MMQYQALLGKILQYGTVKGDRTGTGTKSIFGHEMRFDLRESFPLVTTKRVHFKSVVHELLWMIGGWTNVGPLQRHGVTIWDEWANADGDLGPVYGKQWRGWTTYKRCRDGTFYRDSIDQLSLVLKEIKANPDSRRLIVSAWNPADLDKMALSPCHCLFQFNTRPLTFEQRLDWLRDHTEHYELDSLVPGLKDMTISEGMDALKAAMDRDGVPSRYLDCRLDQRSADVFLGVPFNIASYALLTHMVAQVSGMAAGEFIWQGGDVHLYSNHYEQAREQLSRETRKPPQIRLNPAVKDLFAFRFEDIELVGYDPCPAIAAPVAV